MILAYIAISIVPIVVCCGPEDKKYNQYTSKQLA